MQIKVQDTEQGFLLEGHGLSERQGLYYTPGSGERQYEKQELMKKDTD